MQPTILGMVILPLALLFIGNPVRLLQLALIVGVFDAGAALVLGGDGGFGLPTAMVPGFLFLGYVVAQYALGMRYPGEGQVLRTALPLIFFLIYAMVTAWLMPSVFAGQMMIWPNRPDPLAPSTVPLAPTSGNVTQSLYLAMNIVFAVLGGLFLTRRAISWRGLLMAYLASGYLVVFLCFWNLASRLTGVWFPADILYSNPSWAIVEQAFGAVPRIQGPFSEPAGVAGFLSGVAFCSLRLCMRGYTTMRPMLLLVTSITSVLLSTSTTGIVMLVCGLPLLLLTGAGDREAMARTRRTLGTLAAAVVIVVAPLAIALPGLVDAASVVIEETLQKGESDSFEERGRMNQSAIDAMIGSWGLGIGWGSTRSSSLIPGILGNSGAVGLGLLLWFAYNLRRLISTANRMAPPDHPARQALDGFLAALCGQFGAGLLSGPTITALTFYLQLALVLGAASRMVIDTPTTGRLRPRPEQLRPLPWRPAA
ncbi:MAG TPA: hypothetical protein VGM87_23505 [Roseomonas sp.]|jgi:hypothetical protein